MKRLLTVYLSAFISAAVMFGLFAHLGAGADDGFSLAVWRFAAFTVGAASAIATWASAVWIATVHRTVWPLVIAVFGVCAASAAILF